MVKIEKATKTIALSALVSVAMVSAIVVQFPVQAANSGKAQGSQAQAEKDKEKAGEKDKEKDKTSAEKAKEKAAAAKPEPVIPDVVPVSTDQLVEKPHEFLNKNIRFTANFASFSNLALDYKPAMRSSKTNVSFLVYRPTTKVPYSEIKLAMPLPKETEPENHLLLSLKDGDEVEVTGKVFATALDEPWVDVLRLKKLHAVQDDKKVADAKEKDKDREKASGEVAPNEKGSVPKELKKPNVPSDPDVDKTKSHDGGNK